MNRRDFLGISLAGAVALPLLEKLITPDRGWHPSMIPGCLSWDGVAYGPDGSSEAALDSQPHGGMFNRVLTNREVGQIYSYLNHKYGFNLPTAD